MTRRHVYLVPIGLILAAFAQPGAESVQRGTGILVDTDVRPVRAVRSSPVQIEEAPLFRIDPRRPSGMIADIEVRVAIPDVPRSIEEGRPRR